MRIRVFHKGDEPFGCSDVVIVSRVDRWNIEAFGERLDGREATLFRDRMLAETPLTLQEVGDQYGISRERARQIEKRLLKKLRKFLQRELGTSVDIAAMIRE